MEYTQQQVRLAIGVSPETFRYWKGLLPPLAKKSGKTALFSAGDMLALAIVSRLVRMYRMDISAVTPIADALFSLCSRPLLFSHQPTMVWLDLEAPSIAVANEPKDLPADRFCLVVPVSAVWEHISANLAQTDRPGDQRELLPIASVS